MVDVPESRLADLQRAARLLDSVYTDPEIGMQVKRVVKRIEPNTPIPELAAESVLAPVMEQVGGIAAAVAKMNERLDAEALERQQAAQADKLAREMAAARTRFQLTDEGTEGMIALMREKGITDPVDAAELYVARQPKPKLASARNTYGSSYQDVTGVGSDKAKEELLTKDYDRFFAQEIEEIMNDPALAA